MLDLSDARPAFGEALRRFSSPSLILAERDDYAIAALHARKGRGHALAERFQERFGAALRSGPYRIAAGNAFALGVGPGQWLVLREGKDGPWASRLAQDFSGLASVTDQSDGYAVVRISGRCARDVLAKGLPIDLHPSVFGVSDGAATQVAYMGATIWQLDDTPTFEIAVFRSFAGSFEHWLLASAAAFV